MHGCGGMRMTRRLRGCVMVAKKIDARAKRKPYSFHEFPRGRGKLMCELCGLPLRDHKMDTHPLVAKGGSS